MAFILDWFQNAPRRVLAAISAVCIAMLAFGVYLQTVVGLDPCPMCIVQRYAFVLVAIVAGVGAVFKGSGAHVTSGVLMTLVSGFGAFVAARQSWLQWYPPEVVSCGRDFYGMIENFPLRRALPMIFRGTGDCTKVDWTFLGGSIANWAFLVFCAFGVAGIVLALSRWGAVRWPRDASAASAS